ncbi:phage portal protein [Nocardioides antri]|uniref:phage portal protein n=1 Tax=Nocardioides antri TaxID=2607659 RepID=UPI00165F99CF|nr:phage portal protein [Nocardioides antri]
MTRATSLITGPLTAAPFRVQQLGAGSPLQTPRWVTDPMLLRPDNRLVTSESVYPAVNRLSRSDFWTGFLRSAIWWGLGAFVCQEDESGAPLAGTLRLINPNLLSTKRAKDDGSLRWVLGDGGDEVLFTRDGYATVGPVTYRLVAMRNPHSPVDVDGRSQGVFGMHPATFGLASQVDTYASGTFRSGVPAGYIKVNQPGLTQEQATALKEAWLGAHGGDSRSVAILNATTDFSPISMSPVDTALVEVKRLVIADVAFSFGIDPMNLGVSLANSATYSNTRDAWLNHRDFGLSPWITALQDTLSALLPGDRTVKVAVDGFANPPAGERYQAYKVAIDAGILTVDEVRALEGLPALELEKAPKTPPDTELPSISEEEEATNGDT